MGYTTELYGQFKVHPPFKPEHQAYLLAFSDSRRMKRNAVLTAKLDDPIRVAAGLPVGPDGGYFVGALDDGSPAPELDLTGNDITDYNRPPEGQPGLWCQWVPTDEGTAIQWNGAEKFYAYTEWIDYLITHFLRPWGYAVNGEFEWQGEDRGDTGTIVIRDNEVLVSPPAGSMASTQRGAWMDDPKPSTSEPKTSEENPLGQSLDAMRKQVWATARINHPSLTWEEFVRFSDAFGF